MMKNNYLMDSMHLRMHLNLVAVDNKHLGLDVSIHAHVATTHLP